MVFKNCTIRNKNLVVPGLIFGRVTFYSDFLPGKKSFAGIHAASSEEDLVKIDEDLNSSGWMPGSPGGSQGRMGRAKQATGGEIASRPKGGIWECTKLKEKESWESLKLSYMHV